MDANFHFPHTLSNRYNRVSAAFFAASSYSKICKQPMDIPALKDLKIQFLTVHLLEESLRSVHPAIGFMCHLVTAAVLVYAFHGTGCRGFKICYQILIAPSFI